MKRVIRWILLLVGVPLLALGLWIGYVLGKEAYDKYQQAKYRENLQFTASPQVFKDSVYIDYLDTTRTIYVYLPPSYESDTLRYPVYYFFDGGSLFDDRVLKGPEWQVDEVLDSMAHIGKQTAIVIGVTNSPNRRKEYTPYPNEKLGKVEEISGQAHAGWIATDLKAWVDSTFRTLPDRAHTTIGGASLGGLMAYYSLMTYPEVFGQALVFSPSFWVDRSVYDLHKAQADLAHFRIFFVAGEEEAEIVRVVHKMEAELLAAGMSSQQVGVHVVEDEGHWHPTWREGFAKGYPWLVQP